jgi:uncharacterized protein
MPDTISSWLFWLFMFSAYGFRCTKPGRSPALLNSYADSLTPVVLSLSEALQPFSAVVVTGGSSGIGKSFIELGRKLGPKLIFCNLSRRPPPENIFCDAPERLNHFTCDLTDPKALDDAVASIVELLDREVPAGQILLINNSGIGTFGRFQELNLAQELAMIDLNVRAVVQLTGRLLPLLRRRGGAILNVASTVAFQPTAYAATYGASKAFILHWTLALNEELRGTGVRALALCPGTTVTDFFARAGLGSDATANAFAMSSEEVVDAAFRALAAGRAQVVPGWKNRLYTTASSFVSKPFAARVAAKIMRRNRLGRV